MILLRISEDALQDLNEGFLFYEAQQEGLGDYFASCLRADVESLRVHAGIHRIAYRNFHRLLSRVFPYGIFYTVGDGAAVIWAVVDLPRDPAWIRQRLNP
ncbi:MAG: type II toxin-antitoxin system RelE/ParE family toxin [Limisphaerales bacterium]